MKLLRKLLVFLSAGLFVIFVLAVVAAFVLHFKNLPPKAPELTYVLPSSQTSFKVGDKFSIPLYLTGKDSLNATAYDVKIYYDSSKVKLTDVTPGTFYDKYLTVKWDVKNSWFALALSPVTGNKQSHPENPLLTLQFTALTKTSSTAISTGSSTVYVAKTGGFQPLSATVNIKVN